MTNANETTALLTKTETALRMAAYYFSAPYYPGRENDIRRSDAEFAAALTEYRAACDAAGIVPEWFQRN